MAADGYIHTDQHAPDKGCLADRVIAARFGAIRGRSGLARRAALPETARALLGQRFFEKGMLMSKKLMIVAGAGLLSLAACNHNTQGADNVISVADNTASAMDANATAMHDMADNMGGAAGNAMDNAADALDNKSDAVQAAGQNKADALNKAVKN